ncbi:MAG: 5-formyltetrahydrofolate cyclo-ligase [Clostridiales bacterium]|nr:5-formyltetrahydrofolate cyclo-ligase [Clostridiales bacterium]
MNKSDLRKIMANKRSRIPIKIRTSKSEIIMNKLRSLQIYNDSKLIFVYVSFRSEVETHSFINQALKDGKRIAVPLTISEGKLLLPCEIYSLDDLAPRTLGILEPDKDNIKEVNSKDIDLAVVPGLAFDPSGNRLGFGAGYYDRFLPSLRKGAITIGVCFDEQLVEQLPVEDFDVPLDAVLTNLGLIQSEKP